MRILVVEDEAGIADFLERGLRAEGHDPIVAVDGLEGERLALSGAADLVVLDRLLPGRDGLDVLTAIRRSMPELPVIVLTAVAEVADRVEGLDRGATDYLTKPFAFEELAARIRAHARPERGEPTRLEAGDLALDLLRRTVSGPEAEVRLAEREASLLAHLIRHSGQVCERGELLSSVWGYRHDPGTNVVQVYVGYLRKRLRAAGSETSIETVRGVGYRLATGA